jgi:hypothetical protein
MFARKNDCWDGLTRCSSPPHILALSFSRMKYIKSIITVIILSNVIFHGADAIFCQINNCYNDVASRIAISSLGLLLFVVYTACTVFLVFLPNLYFVKLLGCLKANTETLRTPTNKKFSQRPS